MPAYTIKPQGELTQRSPRIKDAKHLTFIRKLLCLTCNKDGVEAAHIRYGSLDYDKRETGMQERPDDKWAVPLCPACHREGPGAQHKFKERGWWEHRGIDPLSMAQKLHSVSGDEDAGREVILERDRT